MKQKLKSKEITRYRSYLKTLRQDTGVSLTQLAERTKRKGAKRSSLGNLETTETSPFDFELINDYLALRCMNVVEFFDLGSPGTTPETWGLKHLRFKKHGPSIADFLFSLFQHHDGLKYLFENRTKYRNQLAKAILKEESSPIKVLEVTNQNKDFDNPVQLIERNRTSQSTEANQEYWTKLITENKWLVEIAPKSNFYAEFSSAPQIHALTPAVDDIVIQLAFLWARKRDPIPQIIQLDVGAILRRLLKMRLKKNNNREAAKLDVEKWATDLLETQDRTFALVLVGMSQLMDYCEESNKYLEDATVTDVRSILRTVIAKAREKKQGKLSVVFYPNSGSRHKKFHRSWIPLASMNDNDREASLIKSFDDSSYYHLEIPAFWKKEANKIKVNSSRLKWYCYHLLRGFEHNEHVPGGRYIDKRNIVKTIEDHVNTIAISSASKETYEEVWATIDRKIIQCALLSCLGLSGETIKGPSL